MNDEKYNGKISRAEIRGEVVNHLLDDKQLETYHRIKNLAGTDDVKMLLMVSIKLRRRGWTQNSENRWIAPE